MMPSLFHNSATPACLLSNAPIPPWPAPGGARLRRVPFAIAGTLLLAPQVLNRFARHYQSGNPCRNAGGQDHRRATQSGFRHLEYLASAMIDMELHLAGDRRSMPLSSNDTLMHWDGRAGHAPSHAAVQPHFFQRRLCAATTAICGRHAGGRRMEAFRSGDVFDPQLAERLRSFIFTTGNSHEPEVAYRGFRGRDPDVNALLRKRGFAAHQ
jgi:peptidyl-dipeptidase Dcp